MCFEAESPIYTIVKRKIFDMICSVNSKLNGHIRHNILSMFFVFLLSHDIYI